MFKYLDVTRSVALYLYVLLPKNVFHSLLIHPLRALPIDFQYKEREKDQTDLE